MSCSYSVVERYRVIEPADGNASFVFAVGVLYLMTAGVRLLPERIPADEDLVEGYALQEPRTWSSRQTRQIVTQLH